MHDIETVLTHAERPPREVVTGRDHLAPLTLHYTTNGQPGAYRVPPLAGYTLTGRFSAPSLTLLVCADPEQPSRPTFAALVTPATWRGLAALILEEHP